MGRKKKAKDKTVKVDIFSFITTGAVNDKVHYGAILTKEFIDSQFELVVSNTADDYHSYSYTYHNVVYGILVHDSKIRDVHINLEHNTDIKLYLDKGHTVRINKIKGIERFLSALEELDIEYSIDHSASITKGFIMNINKGQGAKLLFVTEGTYFGLYRIFSAPAF